MPKFPPFGEDDFATSILRNSFWEILYCIRANLQGVIDECCENDEIRIQFCRTQEKKVILVACNCASLGIALILNDREAKFSADYSLPVLDISRANG